MSFRVSELAYDDAEFPEYLREIPDPPERLFYVGDLSLLKARRIAVVGSRRYTVYGRATAKLIGRTLAQAGVSVVSGLAYGIDAFAHAGALEADGRAIAVLGMGHRRFGPVKNMELFRRICETGLVISEYEEDFPGSPYSFPRRNRLISGAAENVVLVEAGFKSGALITAQHALEQGRGVYAVPGNINSQFSLGTNLLIRDGARPLIIIDDILRDMNVETSNIIEEKVELGSDEQAVFDAVARKDGVTVNEISRLADMRVEHVSAILTVLEIKGAVVSFGGKIYLAK